MHPMPFDPTLFIISFLTYNHTFSSFPSHTVHSCSTSGVTSKYQARLSNPPMTHQIPLFDMVSSIYFFHLPFIVIEYKYVLCLRSAPFVEAVQSTKCLTEVDVIHKIIFNRFSRLAYFLTYIYYTFLHVSFSKLYILPPMTSFFMHHSVSLILELPIFLCICLSISYHKSKMNYFSVWSLLDYYFSYTVSIYPSHNSAFALCHFSSYT